MCDNLNLSVKLTNGITPFFRSKMGVGQGCSISPMLFNLFINDLIEQLQGGMTEPVKINRCHVIALYVLMICYYCQKVWKVCHSMDKSEYYSVKWRLGISSKKPR